MSDRRLVTIGETRSFLAKAEGLLSDAEREGLKVLLATEPEQGALLRGTGGIRKIRVGLQGRGKSDGARVVYYYRNAVMPLFLLTEFAKNEKDNLRPAEHNQLSALVKVLVESYGRRP